MTTVRNRIILVQYDFGLCPERRTFLKTSEFEKYQSVRRKNDDEWDSAISHFGIAKGQLMIIWTLWDFERPCTQKEICDDWYENKQTINSAAKKLIDEGYIDIAPSPDNFREKLLTFTKKGRFFAMHTVGRILEAEKNAFDRLSEDEQKHLVLIYEKHHKLLKEEFAKIKGENK